MRRLSFVLSVFSACLWAVPAFAGDEGAAPDEVVLGEPVVDVVVDRTHATMRVRHVARTESTEPLEDIESVAFPVAGVVDGFRVRRWGGAWSSARLLGADAAQKVFDGGAGHSKPAALLRWVDDGSASLLVRPVTRAKPISVEYTVVLPVEYDDGVYQVELAGADATDATVRPAHAGDSVHFDRDAMRIELQRHAPPPVDGSLGVATAGSTSVVRFSYELAPQLSEIERGTHAVVLIDGSRSVGKDQIVASRVAAEAYLRHFADPKLDARAQVIVFDRGASRTTRLGPIDAAIEQLQTLNLEPRNGSHVEEALRVAASALRAAPATAPRRIVLITDARTRRSVEVSTLTALAEQSGAVLQIASMSNTAATLFRSDEDHRWASVAHATGGACWFAAAPAQGADMAEVSSVLTALARPIRIDKAALIADGVDLTGFDLPDALDEGVGISVVTTSASRVKSVTLRGELWSQPFEMTLKPNAAEGRRWAGLAFAAGVTERLDDEEKMQLAKLARVLTEHTSFVVSGAKHLEDWVEGLSIGGISSGCGCGGSSIGGIGRRGRISIRPPKFDHIAFLQAKVRDAIAACTDEASGGWATIETTGVEIVDVAVEGSKADACVAEGVWEVRLPSQFTADKAYEVHV